MAKSYPDNIPHPWDKDDLLVDAYKRGWNHGHGIACHNVPKLGDKLWAYDMGHVTVDAENIRDVHQSACYLAVHNSRQYSPFELTAKEFNSYAPDMFGIEEHERGSFNVVGPVGTEATGFDSREAAQAWIDNCPYADDLWEAFEEGTTDAIQADLEEYTDEDYGIEDKKEWWSCSGLINLSMTMGQARSASHSGSCDDDVRALSKDPEIKTQLDGINAGELAKELKKYGAWDETELADHDQNLQRLVWIAAGDIAEGGN